MRAHDGALHGTVLVVDDEDDVAQSIGETIEVYLDVRSVTANSGPEALRVLHREPVDLILSDYRMPGMDGLRFLREARLAAPNVPRVLITAYPDLDVALRALNEERVIAFLPKPVHAPDLVELVAACLRHRQVDVGRLRSIAKALGRLREDPGE